MSVRYSTVAAASVAALAIATPTAAQTSAVQSQLDAIKQQMQHITETYEQHVRTLRERIQALEQKEAEDAARAAAAAAAAPPATAQAPGSFSVGGQSFQVGLSVTGAGGGSSASDAELDMLQHGHHDPKKNGFTLQNAELFVGGSVDPYFDGQANIAFTIDAEGETTVELEEAFFTTRSLPAGLQVKGGQYFTEFGRINTQHPHQWSFVDQPVIRSRLFGSDGLRSQGARVSWLAPTPWYSELIVGAQNARGETAVSFLGEEDEDVGGFTLMERSVEGAGDLLYSARWLNGFDASDTVSVNVGVSGAMGPNATGEDTNTYIFGGDLYAKWQPETTTRGFPFVALHAEFMRRIYEALDDSDPEHTTLHDWGAFGQALWGFMPGWIAGLRLDYATGDGDSAADPLRDERWRLSPNITWLPTEFSKVRLQYNRDWADHLETTGDGGTADTVWLQVEFSLGGHFAHSF